MPKKTRTKAQRPLRVGFDLDGVVLYNPARIIRRPVIAFKHLFLPKREKVFFYPQKKSLQWVNRLMHLSSFMVAPGFKNIIKLARKGKIEPYIITARWDFLEPEFNWWMKKLHIPIHFKGHFMNSKNEQPHLFKERMIKELNLDVFVEDNLDIVHHLEKSTDARVLWIYNIFDHFVKHDSKFPTLDKAVKYIHKHVLNK